MMQRTSNGVILVATVVVAILQLFVVITQVGPPWLQPLLLVLLIVLASLWAWSTLQTETPSERRYNEVEPDHSIRGQKYEDINAYRWLAQRYGIGYDLLDVECEIREKGVAVRRHLKVEAYSGVRQIDNTLALNPDKGSTPELAPPKIRSLDAARILEIDRVINKPDAIVVNISPPLRDSDSTEFELTEEVKGEFYKTTISQSELQRRTKEDDQDFFGWRIDRPTRKLCLKVTFPSSASPQSYFYRVYFASVVQGLPPREQREELRRIPAPSLRMAAGQPQLVLEVDYPAVGLLYALYWNPPVDISSNESVKLNLAVAHGDALGQADADHQSQ